MPKSQLLRWVAAAAFLGASSANVSATESASSVYLPGQKAALAGLTPPPGLFVSNDWYFYEGSAGGETGLPFGGEIVFDADIQLILDVPTAIWITKAEILGGRLGFAASFPIIHADLNATVNKGKFESDLTTFADPVLTALLGWQTGNFHWQAGVNVNIPIGDYREGEILNVARHYWSGNFYGAITWLDPKIGLDLSSTFGITVNAENPSTDYRSGTEFHWDWAAVQHFNEQFSAGLVGYYYQQITGDSGDGAVLGDFKGMVAAIGATVGFNFKLGEIPVSTNLRYYHEFAAENRPEGDAVFFSAAIPLWVPGH